MATTYATTLRKAVFATPRARKMVETIVGYLNTFYLGFIGDGWGCLTYANVGNGTSNGQLRTNAAVTYKINGVLYTKASTDDLWDLSGLTTLAADEFQAHALCLNAAGTASVVSGAVTDVDADTALENLQSLRDAEKVTVGVFVAGNSCDYTAALAAQGTIYNGIPASALPQLVQLIGK